MTVPDVPSPSNPPPQKGCLAALLGFLGVIMLLPGVCSFGFMIASKGQAPADIWSIWLTTYLIAGVGFALIVYGLRKNSP
jgi:hypothetical protein